ncbi:MAG TPA: DUF2752 domain-containing protein [Acidimicrobiales bacterium]|nr:DUF2752 domain-containing protein [Acidimicrobiales bacterium]
MIEHASAALAGRGRGIGVAGLAMTALAYVAVVDPHRPGALLPPCPTKFLTGLDCPACGGLRLAHDLLHGDISSAVHDNLFLLLSSPALALVLLRGWRNGEQIPAQQIPIRVAVGFAASGMAWMVVRNLPFWRLKPTMRTA